MQKLYLKPRKRKYKKKINAIGGCEYQETQLLSQIYSVVIEIVTNKSGFWLVCTRVSKFKLRVKLDECNLVTVKGFLVKCFHRHTHRLNQRRLQRYVNFPN